MLNNISSGSEQTMHLSSPMLVVPMKDVFNTTFIVEVEHPSSSHPMWGKLCNSRNSLKMGDISMKW